MEGGFFLLERGAFFVLAKKTRGSHDGERISGVCTGLGSLFEERAGCFFSKKGRAPWFLGVLCLRSGARLDRKPVGGTARDGARGKPRRKRALVERRVVPLASAFVLNVPPERGVVRFRGRDSDPSARRVVHLRVQQSEQGRAFADAVGVERTRVRAHALPRAKKNRRSGTPGGGRCTRRGAASRLRERCNRRSASTAC